MKITLFGAAGNMGRRIAREALDRGHDLTAIVRGKDEPISSDDRVHVAHGDATRLKDVERLCAGAEIVIAATRPPAGHESQLLESTATLLKALAHTSTRLLISGGAASLLVPDRAGRLLIEDSRYMPESAMAIGQACLEQLELCRASIGVDWTYLSPSALLVPGERTGNFRVGSEELITDSNGLSKISMEDLAVALLDEVEQARFIRRRFTAGY